MKKIHFCPQNEPVLDGMSPRSQVTYMAPRERISVSLFGIKAEAEGLKGIAAFVLVAALLFIARFAGLF